MSSLPGRIGRYEIIEEIGRGGMGVVYKARDPNIGRMVALKVIRLSFEADGDLAGEMRERFRREAKAAGVLHHQNIVTVFDAGEDEGTPFIAMEYVEGETLDCLCGPAAMLPPARANSIVRQIARGLAYAHAAGIIHRDIKLSNILVTPDGTAKLMDFGIARIADSDLTQRGMVMGSPSYMSPEQITGRQTDHRSDIFSLGVVLYQLITGERPFPGENPTVISYRIVREEPPDPSQVNPLVPPGYGKILKKALAKRPADRYDGADEMAEDLARVEEGLEVAPGVGRTRVLRRGSGVKAFLAALWKAWWMKWTAGALAGSAVLIVTVLVSVNLSNPYIGVKELMDAGQHDQAVLALLKLRANKPKDHYAAYLLGREYRRLNDYRSSVKAYALALLQHPDYRFDKQMQDDLVSALSRPDADLAIQLIVSKVGSPVEYKLKEALADPNYNLHWNAAEALRGLGEEVDELPILVLDLKYNSDCKLRRAAVERLGELKDQRALPELELARGDRRNTRSCMGTAVEQAEGRIHEAHPTGN